MKLKKLIEKGPVQYTHYYMQTMTSCEEAPHTIAAPKALRKLVGNHPDADIITYGDGTLGIEINGNVWAVQQPSLERGCKKTLSHDVWHYLNMSMGRRMGSDVPLEVK